MRKYVLYFFALTALLVSCIESAPLPDEVMSSAAGFGSSKRRPEGQPLAFPAGIKIAGKPHWDESCAGKQAFGSGATDFCIQLDNSTNAPLTVTIPAGAVFVSENTESPNGLIVKEINLSIPAKSTSTFHLTTHSINQDRKARPAGFEVQQLLTNHYDLPELLGILAAKRINAEDYGREMPPAEISATVQTAVHEIAHTGQLSSASREKLTQLPDK
jgi:hypothetical protein